MFDPLGIATEDADAEDLDLAEVPRDLALAFIAAAVLAQAGLFAASLGAMLWWFRGQATLGGGLVLAGGVALVATAAIARRVRRGPPERS